MVLVFYLLCILLMMLVRPTLNVYFLKKGKMAVYSALYFIPVLALFHTIIGGLICTFLQLLCIYRHFFYYIYHIFPDYAFPYLSIIISMISNAAHFSMKLDQSMKSLFLSSITETKNCIIIGNIFLLHLIFFKSNIFFFLISNLFHGYISVGHWLILAYGIMSLTASNVILLVMVPLPALFYIFTVKFTDPSGYRDRDERNH